MAKVAVSDDGCWIFRGALDTEGYGVVGMVTAPGKYGKEHAHRVVYAHLVGPIAEGLVLHHVCEVRSCVNPKEIDGLEETLAVARDTVERLSAALAVSALTEARLQAQVARLKESAWPKDVHEQYLRTLDERDELQAEVERLRDALDGLYEAHGCRNKWGDRDAVGSVCTCGECQDALDALAGKETPDAC